MELTGGRQGKIFKTENRVIRPVNNWTPHIHKFLEYAENLTIDFLPKVYELTETHESLSFMKGMVYNDPLPAFFSQDLTLISAARLLKRFHEAGKSYLKSNQLTGEEQWMLPISLPLEVMCHGDYAPYNVTIINERAVGIIDFDTLHPGSKIEDISYAVYRWVPFYSNKFNPVSLSEKIRKTLVFLKSYGDNGLQNRQLVDTMINRLNQLIAFMEVEAESGNQDFQRNIAAGHLNQYHADIVYIKKYKNQIENGLNQIKESKN